MIHHGKITCRLSVQMGSSALVNGGQIEQHFIRLYYFIFQECDDKQNELMKEVGLRYGKLYIAVSFLILVR